MITQTNRGRMFDESDARGLESDSYGMCSKAEHNVPKIAASIKQVSRSLLETSMGRPAHLLDNRLRTI